MSIVDEYAVARREVKALAQYVRFVRVITKRPDLYSSVEVDVYNSFGAVLYVGKSAFAAKDSDLLIALNDGLFIPKEIKIAVVYSEKACFDNVYSVKNSSFIPREFENETDGIDDFCFFCAVFETCGYKIEKIPVFCDAKSILYKTFA